MKFSFFRYTIFAFLFFSSNLIFAQDCSELDNIALKCLNRKLQPQEINAIGSCSDPESKKRLIDYIMTNEAFINRLILIMRLEFLQGTTIDNLREAIQDFDLIMFTQPDNYDWAKSESEKMYKVYHLEGDYANNEISFEDIYITYFNNWTYDQQNMGVNNFIVSTFSYAIGRSPTNSEKASALRMIENETSALLYMEGSSKLDYLRILTSNYNFLEKQVKYWHYFFLNEYPDNQSIFNLITDLKKTKSKIGVADIIRYIITYKIIA